MTRRRHGAALVAFWCWLALIGPLSAVRAQTLEFETEDLPPFNYLDDIGNVAGPSRELIEEACRRIGRACRFTLLPWRRVLLDAQDGRVTGIFSLGRNPERETWMYFSRPLMTTAYAFFAKIGETPPYESLQSLKGYTIATYGPSNLSTTLNQLATAIPDARVEIELDHETAMRKLVTGRYQKPAAAYLNLAVVADRLRRTDITGVALIARERELTYHIGYPKKTTPEEVPRRIDEALVAMQADGFTERVLSRHGVDVPSRFAP